MNFLLAWVFFSFGAAAGLPQISDDKIEEVGERLKKIKRKEAVWWLLASLVLIAAACFPIFWKNGDFLPDKKIQTENGALAPSPVDVKVFFSDLNLEAESFLVYAADEGKIISGRNYFEPRPLASLTKILTALVARNLSAKAGKTIFIDEESLLSDGDTGLRLGSTWDLKKISDLTLVSSSNDGAAAIANSVGFLAGMNFIDEMNKTAAMAGMASSTFQSVTGLDLPDGRPGATGTALDVARLFSHVLKNEPDLLAVTNRTFYSAQSLENEFYSVQNTNKAIQTMPGLIASKTGFTDTAGGNLAIAANIGLNRPVIFVVLGSSHEDRFADTARLIAATQAYYSELGYNY